MKFREDSIFIDIEEKIHRKYSGNAQKIDMSDVFPEYLFKSPYGRWSSVAPVRYYFPFYRQLVVGIEPFQDKTNFEKMYGVRMDEMIRLCKEGKVILLLEAPHRRYPQWMEPLFKSCALPRPGRLDVAYYAASGEYKPFPRMATEDPLFDIRTKVIQRFHEKPIDQSTLNQYIRPFAPLGQGEERLVNMVASNLATLKILGFEDALSKLMKIEDAGAMFFASSLASKVLATEIHGVGGWMNWSTDHMQMAKQLMTILMPSQKESREILTTTSSELLAALSVELGYGGPEYWDVDSILRVTESNDVVDNYKILLDMARYIEECRFDDANSRCIEAQESIRNLRAEVERVGKHFKIVRSIIYPLFALLSPVALASLGSSSLQITLPLSILPAASLALDEVKKNLDKASAFVARRTARVHASGFLTWKRSQQFDQDLR